jgi:Sulfotransferase family
MTADGPERAGFSGPVFVTGMWRSGSSLLYALLNKHPRVALMYEADLALLRPVFWKPGAGDWPQRWEFWNGAVRRHGFDPAELAGKASGFRSAYELVYREYARRQEATIWGDKSPDLHDRMTLMARVFPGARFIILWRNPAAVCSSMAAAAAKGASFFRKPGMALRGLLGCETLRRQCDRLLEAGVPVCELDYEDLVRDPATTMQRVSDFLGIPYEAGLATLEGADRDAIHGGEHHSLLRGTKIVAGARPEVLNDALRAKIERYVRWWRRRRKDGWPRHAALREGESSIPSVMERLQDRVLYRLWRAVDAFTRLAFCHAPLGWLRWYRQRKGSKT